MSDPKKELTGLELLIKAATGIKDKFVSPNVKNAVTDKKEAPSLLKFLGIKKKATVASAMGNTSFTDKEVSVVLKSFVSFMGKMSRQKKENLLYDIKFEKEQETLRETRHKEIMNVFLQATKKSTKAKREIVKRVPKPPPAKPAEPVKPAGPPAKPAGPPAKPAEPVKPAGPPAKPAEPVKPAPPAKPAEPAKPDAAEIAKQQAAERARRQAEEAARKKAADEAAEAARKKAADEAARKQAEEAARKKAADEAARKQAEEAARKKAADEAARETAKKVEPVKPAEPVKKVEPAPAAPPTAQPAPVAKPTPSAKPVPKTTTATAGKEMVLAALTAAGYSKAAQANILANVDKESGFVPKSEEIQRYTGANIFRMFGPPGVAGGQPEKGRNTVKFKTIEEANDVVKKGPEAVAEILYGMRKDLGNDQPGDGWKYRGRGFIQITGKDMYRKVGKEINVDLVSNPDLANDPAIAAKIIPAFFKLKLGKNKPSDLEDIQIVNKMVGSADVKSREKRVSLAQNYLSELQGDKINSTSVENADTKKQLSQGQGATTIVNSQTNNNTNVSRPQTAPQSNPNPMLGR